MHSAENVVPRIVWDMPQTCRLCGWDTMHDNRVCAPCSRVIPPGKGNDGTPE